MSIGLSLTGFKVEKTQALIRLRAFLIYTGCSPVRLLDQRNRDWHIFYLSQTKEMSEVHIVIGKSIQFFFDRLRRSALRLHIFSPFTFDGWKVAEASGESV